MKINDTKENFLIFFFFIGKMKKNCFLHKFRQKNDIIFKNYETFYTRIDFKKKNDMRMMIPLEKMTFK